MASPTTWKGMTYPAHGGAVNAWDTPLNADFDQIDTMIGGTLPLTLASTTPSIALTAAQTWNAQFDLTGTSTTTVTISLLSSVSGGVYCFNNATTGSFSTQVTTSSTGAGTPIVVPQGGRTLLRSNGHVVAKADDTAQAKLYTQTGTPQGNVAGTGGTVDGDSTDVVYDQDNKQLYVCGTTGTSTSAVWIPSGIVPSPMGYLSPVASTTNPIITADALAATTIYYTPLIGNWTPLSNGVTLYPYQFSQMSLVLTVSQAASNFYDIFMFKDATAGVVIGTGPSWSAGGGSVAAGTSARGTGAGSTELTRLLGVWVNNVQVTLTNNITTYTCPAFEGIYLGTIFINTSAGQVTCHRAWGSSRKWGVWNAYNRQPIYLKMGDSTASWVYNSATVRQSRATTTNTLAVFMGLAEEQVDLAFVQTVTGPVGSAAVGEGVGIGINSTTTMTGYVQFQIYNDTSGFGAAGGARHMMAPSLGLNNINSLEFSGVATTTFFGSEDDMYMTAMWRA